MKKYIVMFSILILAMLTSLVYLLQGNNYTTEKEGVGETVLSDELVNFNEQLRGEIGKRLSEKVEPTVTSTTIAGIGDLLISTSVISDARQGDGSFNFKPMFELVKPYISQADITVANQETILGGSELGFSGYPRFNSPNEVGEALIDIGVDVVSIANNHTLDKGERGVLNAIDYYHSIDLPYTGAYNTMEDRSIIRTIEKNDIVFSFLAYSYGTNGIPVPSGKDYLINLIDVDLINADILAAKEISDVVVLSLHFGNEYERLPNETQRMLVEEFSAAGADIIFGHHPHVLQPMEWIEQDDGRQTFVAYSLGNFISGQVGIEREIGGIVQLQVEKTAFRNQVSVELKEPRFLPTYTYKQKWRYYKVYPLYEINDEHVLRNHDEHLQDTKKHVSQWMPELKFEFE